MLRRIALNPAFREVARASTSRAYVRLLNMDRDQLEQEVTTTRQGKAVSNIQEFDGWNANLASTSEEVVKAEKSGKKSFSALQQETIDVIRRKEESKSFPMKGTNNSARAE